MGQQAQWLEAEFGWHAERVTEAGLALGLDDLVPIACRGSSHPALLDQLARLIGARPGLERSEEHTSELQSRVDLVCRLLLEKKKKKWLPLASDRAITRWISLL